MIEHRRDGEIHVVTLDNGPNRIDPAWQARMLNLMKGKESAQVARDAVLTGKRYAADEAIAVCQRSLRGNFEAIAHGVRARALLRGEGKAAQGDVRAALDASAALIDSTGASTLAPAHCEWRAELAGARGDAAPRDRLLQEALRGYTESGAIGHAERLTRDLP